MKLVAASDHAGRVLKDLLVADLRAKGHEVDDLGTHTDASVDYPDYAKLAGEAVAAGTYPLGLLVCGSGTGICIAANKVHGVRAANCVNEWMARMARAHNDANIVCIGERVVGPGLAIAIVDAFVAGAFEGGRHERRVGKVRAMDGT